MERDLLDDHVSMVDLWLAERQEKAGVYTIIFHGDCDGVISAALFDYILNESPGNREIHHIPVRTEQYDLEHAMRHIGAMIPDVTIFLDLSVQNHPEKLQRMAADTKHGVLVYDHHSQYNSAVPDNTLYLNPSITADGYDESSPPPCLFAARLAQRRTGKDFDWAACIGLIAESAAERYVPLFKKAAVQFPRLFPAGKSDSGSNSLTGKLKDITYAIGSAFWALPGEHEQTAFDILSRMLRKYSPEIFFDPFQAEAVALIQLEKIIRTEINRLTAEAEYNSYYAPDLTLRYTEISSEYRIGGVVSTRLARKHKKDIVVTGQKYSGRYVIEARCGARRRIDVAALLKEAAQDLNPYSVGGHPAAAGATLPLDSSPQFFLALEETAKRPNIPSE